MKTTPRRVCLQLSLPSTYHYEGERQLWVVLIVQRGDDKKAPRISLCARSKLGSCPPWISATCGFESRFKGIVGTVDSLKILGGHFSARH